MSTSALKNNGYSLTEEQIARIDKPTLILWGELDAFLSKGDEEKFNQAIASSISNSSLALLQGEWRKGTEVLDLPN